MANACVKSQWDMYYAEYIQNNKNKELNLFDLTNGAILYCMEKLGFKYSSLEKEESNEN